MIAGDMKYLRAGIGRRLAPYMTWRALAVTMAMLALVATGIDAVAQQQPRRGQNVPIRPLPNPKQTPVPKAETPTKTDDAKADDGKTAEPKAAPTRPPEPVEVVQADVSTRNVAVTSSFTGTEIVVFGAIDHSRQASAEAGLYDVVVVVEGTPSRITARKKESVLGIWLNTSSTTFDAVPSYYAIASTRPLDEVAPEATLIGYEIGFDHVRMNPTSQERLPPAQMKAFREAVVRLKQKEGLYVSEPHGVVFIGKSLFRATIALPANVTVGPFDTRVYLFKEERLISQYNLRLNLEREGLELWLHNFAFKQPFFYGLATVVLALLAGLAASALFSKGSH